MWLIYAVKLKGTKEANKITWESRKTVKPSPAKCNRPKNSIPSLMESVTEAVNFCIICDGDIPKKYSFHLKWSRSSSTFKMCLCISRCVGYTCINYCELRDIIEKCFTSYFFLCRPTTMIRFFQFQQLKYRIFTKRCYFLIHHIHYVM